MAAPGILITLALTLHAEHSASAQDHAATLAGRLRYAEVWLPVGGDFGWPDPARLEGLAHAAAGARLGLVVHGDQDDQVAGLLRLDPGESAEILVELPATTAPLVRAIGGPDAWHARVRLPSFDPAAAGTVVTSTSRSATVAGVAAAVAARDAAGLDAGRHVVAASVPVSIGRTFSEAEARALRDPRFAGTGHRDSGLFGTYEQAQTQVLELAAAGADVLRVTVAHEVDVADLLAQVRSLVVGATPVLHARRR